ncbi:anti-sigma factor [uncultured Corynebacterium sp.]|uniref:anti-sigma factor family protein n=1 Tax=uncultured Corynebacterium sp. TaxID=159447 RepID=UPI0025EE15C2|nr:zf-HC2 domain-containing protein [uncultured Corynebacterium sp.]
MTPNGGESADMFNASKKHGGADRFQQGGQGDEDAQETTAKRARAAGDSVLDGPHDLLDKVRAKARRLDSIDHLGPEAVVSFVDGEMSPKAMHRVRVHMVHCKECRDEVHRQRGAAEWVRQCDVSQEVRAPRDLLSKLNDIASRPATAGPDAATPAHKPEQDMLDKLDTLRRALRRGRGA